MVEAGLREGPYPRTERGEEILRVEGLVKHFPVTRGTFFKKVAGLVRAVDGVSFSVREGETLALVGETGSGKTTVARCVLRLIEPTAGRIWFMGHEITGLSRKELRQVRRSMQIVFQDPYASLNPRMTVRSILAEPLVVHGLYGRDGVKRVEELLELVGLNPEHANRYPHEFSGGQRQRIGIARALALNPRLLVLDEPVSALDVSIQAQIVNLLEDLQARFGMTYLLIAHDLGVVRHVAERVAVIYLGKLVEVGTREQVYETPLHPYTQALLSAAPVPDPQKERERKKKRIILAGEVPSPLSPPPGCRFHTRCWKAEALCKQVEPPLVDTGEGHLVACHFPEAREVL